MLFCTIITSHDSNPNINVMLYCWNDTTLFRSPKEVLHGYLSNPISSFYPSHCIIISLDILLYADVNQQQFQFWTLTDLALQDNLLLRTSVVLLKCKKHNKNDGMQQLIRLPGKSAEILWQLLFWFGGLGVIHHSCK